LKIIIRSPNVSSTHENLAGRLTIFCVGKVDSTKKKKGRGLVLLPKQGPTGSGIRVMGWGSTDAQMNKDLTERAEEEGT